MEPLKFENIFIGALKYPDLFWSNYFLIEQKKSEWARGIFLTALNEVYHHCKLVFRIHFDSKKRKVEALKPKDIKLSVQKLTGIDDQTLIDEETLEKLHYAIQRVQYFDKEKSTFTNYEILSLVEYALIFIRQEFNEQLGKSDKNIFRPRTKTYFNYLIAADGPFFDFLVFKNAVRELLCTVLNLAKLTKTLKAFHKISVEIVNLWNEEIYFIETQANSSDTPSSETIRVQFKTDTLEKSWWSGDDFFDNVIPHKHYMNQTFAGFAAGIANLLNQEIINGPKTELKVVKKDFISDIVAGVRELHQLGNKHEAIKNILTKSPLETPFRDFFSIWFKAKNYDPSSESLKGTMHIDLKLKHLSIADKIIEFKGWWNAKKDLVVEQLFNYLTIFDDEGYIFIVNHTRVSIEDNYRQLIAQPKNGYVNNSWKKKRYRNTQFYYYISKHKVDNRTSIVTHFVFDVEFPKIIHKSPRKK